MERNLIPQKIDNFEKIEMSDGVVINKNQFIHTLNPTGMEIFELCDGKLTIQNIIEEMRKRYDDKDIEFVVEDFIAKLKESGLINF